MKLRQRTLLSIGATLVCLVVGIYILASQLLVGSYENLESEETKRNVLRVTDALKQQVSTMHRSTLDWAHWDDTYEFLQTKGKEYIDSNLSTITLKLDSMVFVDKGGRVFYDRPVRRAKAIASIDGESLRRAVGFHLEPSQRPGEHGDVAGFIDYKGQLLLVSSRPIHPTRVNRPPNGWLVFSLVFDPSELEGLSSRTHLQVSLYDLDDAKIPTDCLDAIQALGNSREPLARPLNETEIAGYSILRDIFGRPIKLLRVTDTRVIYSQGVTSVRYLMQFVVLAAIVFSIVILWVLEASTLSRIAKLSEQVQQVGDESPARVSLSGNDELSWLAKQIDGMRSTLNDRKERLRVKNEELNRMVQELAAKNTVFENAVEGISQLDANGLYTHVNGAYARMAKYSISEMEGMHWEMTVSPADHEKFRQAMRDMLETGKAEVEVHGRRSDGTLFHQEVVMIPTSGKDGGQASYCFFKDITERKQLETQIEHQAFHDALTGLPNRVLFLDRLRHAQARANRKELSVAVLFLDLDNFKVINDSLGHEAGDSLLVGIAERLKGCIRPTDTVARLGGDEFTVLLEELHSLDEATDIAHRIVESLQTAIPAPNGNIFATASIGIAYSDLRNEPSEGLLRDADTAMYQAKARGKSSFVVFDSSMNERAVERLEIELGLREAIGSSQLFLHFQPLVDLEQEQVCGMEALLRWNHPQRGMVPPTLFIPIAEETGLIHPLGQWVLLEACRQTKRWHEEFPNHRRLVVSVNLSGKQLQRPDIVEQVAEALTETGLEPRYLKLEITESVLMHDMEDAAQKLRQLKALGIKLAIDDFGTGYSSMSSLSSFPVDTVKIDQTFINRLGVENEVDAVVAAIIMLSKTMRLEITAEGVEDRDQMIHLQALGCNTAQGYFFARPVPADDFRMFLRPEFSLTSSPAA